ncbi:MAG: 2-oxoacid:ferredoxin oxidoreductase subunit beta [Deltaproteobacteria bacterium]|nr:2-oxoacid:ferredoxin oxidoreductase subunit beta [Deltaproteobacteria bacterium]|tara:strand:- start:316 stop:1338 length:1023 start_codon:yes stop_codon:yes gene_type:complete
MTTAAEAKPLTHKDFSSDQEVRWCPGCGDYAILKAMQKTLPTLGHPKENHVFVSGIGCSSRFPYYMNTYGFHTIHGRAPAFATGLKLANPELEVWVITGDGDGFSIGGNHLLHALRRNVNLNIILFNNEIYGLTKGQYSPTSRVGTRSPSTPLGSVDSPLNPCKFALGAGARFVARTVDTNMKAMIATLTAAHGHDGASFVEVFQNCIVFNDGTFADFTDKAVANDRQVIAEHGKPLVYGKEGNYALRVTPGSFRLEAFEIGEGLSVDDALVHDEKDSMIAQMLVELRGPDVPTAVGVIYNDPVEQTYDEGVQLQIADAIEKRGTPDFNELLRKGHTWEV